MYRLLLWNTAELLATHLSVPVFTLTVWQERLSHSLEHQHDSRQQWQEMSENKENPLQIPQRCAVYLFWIFTLHFSLLFLSFSFMWVQDYMTDLGYDKHATMASLSGWWSCICMCNLDYDCDPWTRLPPLALKAARLSCWLSDRFLRGRKMTLSRAYDVSCVLSY